MEELKIEQNPNDHNEVSSLQTNIEEFECVICLNIMVEPCELKCSHKLCIMCIDKLSFSNPECPLCREKILKSFKLSVDEKTQ